MNTIFSVSLFQQNVFSDKVNNNLNSIKKIIHHCKNSDLLVLPEMFNSGFLPQKESYYEFEKTIEFLNKISISNNISIAGSLIYYKNSEFFNRFVFVKPDGTHEFYDKRHLFSIAGEANDFKSGNQKKVIQYKGIRIFPQVCFDLRFPVWSRNVFDYDLLIYVANWPTSRIKQWQSLLVARAIENQAYTVGVNRIGTDRHGFVYNGNSLVIDYKGDIMYKSPDNEEDIHTIELDISKLKKARESFNVLSLRDKFTIS